MVLMGPGCKLHGCESFKARVWPYSVVQPDSSTPTNLASRNIFYEFHPWFGGELRVQGVVEKGMGVVRCTLQGDVQARALEVPLWMFDRLTCLSVRIRKRPQVDLAALDALQRLLAEVVRPGEDSPAVFFDRP